MDPQKQANSSIHVDDFSEIGHFTSAPAEVIPGPPRGRPEVAPRPPRGRGRRPWVERATRGDSLIFSNFGFSVSTMYGRKPYFLIKMRPHAEDLATLDRQIACVRPHFDQKSDIRRDVIETDKSSPDCLRETPLNPKNGYSPRRH